METQNLCFVDFGLEHISLIVCKISENKIISFPFFSSIKIRLPQQRIITPLSQVENFDALINLINDAEKKLKTNISEIILSLKERQIVLYHNTKTIENKRSQKISKSDMEKLSYALINDFYNYYYDNNEILDFICNKFRVDNDDVKNPYKIACKKLTLNGSIIGIQKVFTKNFGAFLERSKIHIKHYISPCVSVANSIYGDNVNKENVLFIDIGSCVTEICLMLNGDLFMLDKIDLGGIDITRDIANTLKLCLKDADIVKIKLSKKEKLKDIANYNETTKMVLREVENIADARFNEIILNVKSILKEKVSQTGVKLHKIILFGGSSNYKNSVEIVQKVMKCDNVVILDNNAIFDNKILSSVDIDRGSFDDNSISLISSVIFYVKNMNIYRNARRGFIYKVPSKISCFLKDLLY